MATRIDRGRLESTLRVGIIGVSPVRGWAATAHIVPDFADAVRRHEVIAAIERSAASGERVKA
jgi:predicted dehydrogenase